MALGSSLMRARTALLDQLPPAKRVLVLGEGDGRLLALLAQAQPEAQITSIDQSPGMLRLQQKRLTAVAAEDRVDWRCADATTAPLPKATYDLVVMAFFLDCFSQRELQGFLPRVLDSLSPEGCVYYVDFVSPPQGIRGWWSHVMLGAMHLFFKWQTGLANRRLVNVSTIFHEQGWRWSHQQNHRGDWLTTRIYVREQSH